MQLKKGNKGNKVKIIQDRLGLEVDGVFGDNTEAAVKKFQKENNLTVDGIVGPNTWSLLKKSSPDSVIKTNEGLDIFKHYLNEGQYLNHGFNKKPEHIFIHHTAGWENPFKVIDYWNSTKARIATEFVIGGQRITDGNAQHDGVTLQAFPEGCSAFHLGITATSSAQHIMNARSIGIELNSFGYLTDDNKTYLGNTADPNQVVKLKEPFREYRKWHKYSSAQIESLRKLLLYLGERNSIDIREGLPKMIKEMGAHKAFEFHKKAFEGEIKGVLSHSNVRWNKFDCYPDPELVEMLVNL